MGKDVLIFLSTFDKKDASMNEKNYFIIRQAEIRCEYSHLGEIYDYMHLPYNNPQGLVSFISAKIKEVKPKWIIAEGTSATALMGMKISNRILVNPHISFDDLNNVPNYVRESTYAFFDKNHEKDYERFLSVYLNSVWYPDNLIELYILKSMIEAIVEEKKLWLIR